MSRGKILLTSVGSLGDLHPFIAVALALKARGFSPMLAVHADHAIKCASAGLDAVAILPSFADISAQMGLSEAEIARRAMRDQFFLLRDLMVPWTMRCVPALEAAAQGACALIGSQFVLSAPMIAEKLDVPFIGTILQPMTLFSPHDPPYCPGFRLLRHPPDTAWGQSWNSFMLGIMRAVLRISFARRLNAARQSLGLRASTTALLVDRDPGTRLTLCCYSSQLSALPPDAPENCITVGFPVFDSGSGAPEQLDAALVAFLAAGPPPLVFTLGSFAVHAPGTFFAQAVALSRVLGQRAVLLSGETPVQRTGETVFITRYAPHSLLFPHASVVIHQGGIGTTGQALRAGKPQLIVPHMGDQYDHAWRITRLGVGLSLAVRRFTSQRAGPLLSRLLADSAIAGQAARIGQQVASENGAEAAANAIEACLAPCHRA
jgi:UDP:flavonoid glycosyltransferase YjiC (YdhE family)